MIGDTYPLDEFHKRAKFDFFDKDAKYFIYHWVQPFESWEHIDRFFPLGSKVKFNISIRFERDGFIQNFINWILLSRSILYFLVKDEVPFSVDHHYLDSKTWEVTLLRPWRQFSVDAYDKDFKLLGWHSASGMSIDEKHILLDYSVSVLIKFIDTYKSIFSRVEQENCIDQLLRYMYRYDTDFI